MKRSGPLVAVCLAPTDLRPEVDDLTGVVRTDPRRADLSAPDAAALEYGLRVAETWGGWVLAIAAGPPQIDPVLSAASAVGAEVLRVEWGSSHNLPAAVAGPRTVNPVELTGDPAAVAGALARVVSEQGRPSLVLCGDRSAASGTGAFPGFLAHELGLDQALGLVGIDIGDAGRLTVQRRLDGGWRETLLIERPSVLSVEAAGVRLRRAALTAVLEAGAATVPVVHPGAVDPSFHSDLRIGPPRPYRPRTRPVPPPRGDTRERLLSLTGVLSNREAPRVLGPLSAAEAADELLSYLERNGYRRPG